MPDYPDGIEQFNLSSQSLSEIINRPKYGAAQRFFISTEPKASAQTLIGTISGKGIIYGGHSRVYDTVTQKLGSYYFIIDGSNFYGCSFNGLNVYQINKEHASMFYLLNFDDTNFRYSVGIMPGLTFETEVKIYYTESNGNTPRVELELLYALI